MGMGQSYKPESFQQKTPAQMSMDKMWFGHETVGNTFAAGNSPFKSAAGARVGYGVQGVQRLQITNTANGNQGVKAPKVNEMQFGNNPFRAQGPSL